MHPTEVQPADANATGLCLHLSWLALSAKPSNLELCGLRVNSVSDPTNVCLAVSGA